MSFLERYEQQLMQASAALGRAPSATRADSEHRWSRRLPRRGVTIGLALVAIAAPAVALVQPWDPPVGRGDQDTLTASGAEVDRSALDAYAILRRPQTERDRRLAEPLLRQMGRPLDQVQLAGVRAIRPGLAVVPVNTIDVNGHLGAGGPQICVLRTATTGCSPVARAVANGVVTLTATTGYTRYEGVVPDGVARVQFMLEPSGETTTAAVKNNYVRLTIPWIGAPTMIPAPNRDGSPSDEKMPGPPTPAPGTLTWLDTANRIVGPNDATRHTAAPRN